ncbi:MAG: flagellar motor switch protein FliN [Thermodesulfobacteriota bacterium]
MATGPDSQVVDFNWDQPLGEESAPPPTPEKNNKVAAPAAVSPAEGEKDSEHPTLDLILDVPLEITAELGRTRMIIHDLLQLGQGSVIELNKLAGEPLEILVNQKLIARGEVVVVNEKFGIRLTDIISPMERIKQLG